GRHHRRRFRAPARRVRGAAVREHGAGAKVGRSRYGCVVPVEDVTASVGSRASSSFRRLPMTLVRSPAGPPAAPPRKVPVTASRSMPPRVSIAAGALWIIAVAAGFYVLIHYSLAPGRPGRPPEQWPAASSLGREPSRPTLVLVVHPRCPCTRASLTELAEIMTQCPGALAARVLFVRPAGLTD